MVIPMQDRITPVIHNSISIPPITLFIVHIVFVLNLSLTLLTIKVNVNHHAMAPTIILSNPNMFVVISLSLAGN